MRRLLSTPPSIRIAAESVDDARDAAVDVPTGLELVPAWQARPGRRRRRLWATMAVAAVVAAAALVASGDHGARGQTARPTPAHAAAPTPGAAVVVSAARATEPGTSRSDR